MLLRGLTAVCLVTIATAAMEGYSNDDDWAFQWYTGEPFTFRCKSPTLNVTSAYFVVWDTPTVKPLPDTTDDDDFKLSSTGGAENDQLLVKKVQSHLHGVYVCHIHDENRAPKGKVVYGLNIHDVKYHKLVDKYRRNIVVAFISTAVFIVPFATICLVWQFRYLTPEEKAKLVERKRFKENRYRVNDHEMKKTIPNDDGIAATVRSPNGEGAYENPDLSTNL